MVVVHVDDFALARPKKFLRVIRKELEEKQQYGIGVQVPGLNKEESEQQSVEYLNRTLRWKPRGVESRHSGKYLHASLEELGMESCKSTISPGSVTPGKEVDMSDDQELMGGRSD